MSNLAERLAKIARSFDERIAECRREISERQAYQDISDWEWGLKYAQADAATIREALAQLSAAEQARGKAAETLKWLGENIGPLHGAEDEGGVLDAILKRIIEEHNALSATTPKGEG